MKTKDGRSAYGTRKCECGNRATVKYCSSWMCERCQRIQKMLFKDKSYAGVCVLENAVIDKGGEAFQVHSWRVGTRRFIDNEDNL